MARPLTALLTVALLIGTDAGAQSSRAPLQGVWRVVEVRIMGPNARTVTTHPEPNLTILTAGYYSRAELHADGPRSAPADVARASADELRAAWGPFVGEAGTYELADGHLMTMRPVVAKNPAAMAPGSFKTYSYTLAADTLWVTAERDQNGAVANPVRVKAVRVE